MHDTTATIVNFAHYFLGCHSIYDYVNFAIYFILLQHTTCALCDLSLHISHVSQWIESADTCR